MRASMSVLSLCLAASAALVTAAPAGAADPVEYVAMGDSYSAASGVLPPSTTPNAAMCTRSSLNYANVLTKEKGYALTDVTCGAATTNDFAGRQFGVVTPQANALSSTTDVVTLTIGGNDEAMFIGMMSACASAGVAASGLGAPCKTIYGNTFTNKLPKIHDNLVKAFTLAKAKAPNARIFAAGYPHILPETSAQGSCFTTMPVAPGDYPLVASVEMGLNDAIRRAAAKTGVTYVDVWGASAGRDACKPVGTRWVEPALFGKNYIPVHPNALGEQAYGRAFSAAIG